MQDLPPELARFAPFLLQESPTAAPTLKAPPTMDEIKIEAATEDGPEPSDIRPVKKLNLKADLAIELALASEGYRLADLILLVSQITKIVVAITRTSPSVASPIIPLNNEYSVSVGATNTTRIIIIVGAVNGISEIVVANVELGS